MNPVQSDRAVELLVSIAFGAIPKDKIREKVCDFLRDDLGILDGMPDGKTDAPSNRRQADGKDRREHRQVRRAGIGDFRG